ncbi:MAG: hypothetical protein MUP16_03355 [Sedimentisphaerales bacterium]|nr:hypothetical protein [Sedimentisphaerales bacterium]
MYKKVIYLICLIVVLSLANSVQADTFSLRPTQDTYVSNDTQTGPTAILSGLDGIHIRNVAGRRRVGYIQYDISSLKRPGRVFSNVSLSNMGWDRGNINIYGLIEAVDSIDVDALNWNTAPGVKNNPTPALDSPVALDFNDLTEQLLPTFRAPARDTRESTQPSEALANFLNSDKDGIIVLVFAPAAVGENGIILSIHDSPDSGTLLQGEFSGFPKTAYDPKPENELGDIPRDVELSWTPGGYADKHNVFLGKVFNDVNNADVVNHPRVMLSQNQDANTYQPDTLLDFVQKYYWRVDEVNAPPNSNFFYRGEVWNFTVEPFSYPLPVPGGSISASASIPSAPNMGPEKTIDGSGLNANDQHSTTSTDMWLSGTAGTEPVWIKYKFDSLYKLDKMWVWNSNQVLEPIVGVGLNNVTIEYSTEDGNWKPLNNVTKFNPASGLDSYTYNTTVDFGGVLAQYVRITANSNWGGFLPQYSLSEVRFFYIPVRARGPQPASASTGVALDAELTWRPGREAATHQVYLSSDSNAVRSGTALIGTVDKSSYPLSSSLSLELGRTYYWKVNEVNEAAIRRVWEGDLWSFTAANFIVVDDFESYNDQCNRIYYSWKDGLPYDANTACGIPAYTGNGTGSAVGNATSPFAEQSIAHLSTQSMPLEYNNSIAPYYSETQREWATAQDWTRGGADTLTVWFYGATTNTAEQIYVAVEDSSGIRRDANLAQPAAVQSATWQQGDIPFTSFAGVNMSSIKKMYIGVGNRTAPTAGSTGKIYIDDIRLYP